jgi:hypothetical protein
MASPNEDQRILHWLRGVDVKGVGRTESDGSLGNLRLDLNGSARESIGQSICSAFHSKLIVHGAIDVPHSSRPLPSQFHQDRTNNLPGDAMQSRKRPATSSVSDARVFKVHQSRNQAPVERKTWHKTRLELYEPKNKSMIREYASKKVASHRVSVRLDSLAGLC